MTPPKRPLKVFLCHAHADRDAVRSLYTRLVNDGVDAWLDKEKLLPGQDWELEIRKAVREADVVVVCLSNQFNQAGFRQKEVRLALDTAMEKPEGEIFIIPARLEECDNLESLRKWHWVDLYEEDGYNKLLRALYSRGDRIGAITYSLRKSDMDAEKARKITFLRSRAEKLELSAEWGIALDCYRQLQRLDPAATDVARKISELSLRLEAGGPGMSAEMKRDAIPSKKNAWMPVSGIIALLACCVLASVSTGWYVWNASNTAPATSPVEVVETLTLPAQVVEPTFPALQTDAEMVLVPAGEFIMGSDKGDPDEKPIRTVYLDAFSIDVYEVSKGAYNECVRAGGCEPTLDQDTVDFSDSTVANFPVVKVDWFMAQAYCEWRGGRLPTEAEWEKAARGPDGMVFPWGSGDLDCTRANYDSCGYVLQPIGSTLNGASPYGLYDLLGNAWEWTADYYGDYSVSATTNPTGPATGELRVIRGASFAYDASFMRPSIRYGFVPSELEADLGFRCAKDVP